MKKKETLENKIICPYCKKEIDIYYYSKYNNYLKIYELKSIWLNKKIDIFCCSICRKKFNQELRTSTISF